MGYIVNVSLKQGLRIPMFCVVCGGTTNLNPRGYFILGRTDKFFMNYRSLFYFPVCSQCTTKNENIKEKRKRFRTLDEKEFLKLYSNKAVTCWLYYRPILGMNWASFTFYRKDFAVMFAQINRDLLK